ncbi:FliM/FliN family flagellar motor C-terminal domain-containing protein [Falsirhodobacter sp. 20TX0035]|uniref:FliM/FliN family flagellar motor C-terminal domain-containing protein n=1 Tax=Falsirhodobacter sp. 20TX0035 TaxID=3022019 RepID=UPI002330C69D|nr:FliM/FliN family flagellar motor C-terminal domain-containing protein [Falsirhodobacter sp. 20TX0035]MDB6453452.1 FliM/FliN family flagellar motor C-terminal domain-containing protein [Falsirhodobacter sp. 20TX0035]
MTIIRQKLSRPAPQEDGAVRAWRQALPRALLEAVGLDVVVTAATVEPVGPADLPALVPDHALILSLHDEGGARGAILLSAELTACIVGMQMTGRIPTDTAARRPTRIDATLCSGAMDAALEALGAGVTADADRWAAGFRSDTFLPDVEALILALSADDLRVMHSKVVLAGAASGGRAASLWLILPARAAMPEAQAEDTAFRADLAEQVLGSETLLHAVLCQFTAPLSAVMQLRVGETIPLPRASLEEVRLETAAGQGVGQGRLGQNRGMRALRLMTEERPRSAEVVPLRGVA